MLTNKIFNKLVVVKVIFVNFIFKVINEINEIFFLMSILNQWNYKKLS